MHSHSSLSFIHTHTHTHKHTTHRDRWIDRWTQCSRKMTGHSELNCPQTDTEDDHPIPSQRGGGCSTITEEGKSARVENISAKLVQACAEEVITALKLQQDLADKRMANPLNPVLGSHTSQERQPAAVSKLLNSQPQQPLKKSHAEDHTEQTEAASGEDHC